ncbi:MAG: TonB family protein [Desulfobulbus sp.]|jgi:protein TonB|nr:TonB family protein [Desulfobulbus sp.]
MSHQRKAIHLSLLLHALLLLCAFVLAGNTAQVKSPVRIELTIAAAGGDGDALQSTAAPEQQKAPPAAVQPRQVVKAEPVQKKTPARSQQVVTVRKPAPVVQQTRSPVPAPAAQPEKEPSAQSVPQVEPVATSSEPTPARAAATTGIGSTGPSAGAGGRNPKGRGGHPVPAGSLDGPLQALSRQQPGYPPAARQQNIEGWIRVQYVVNERGSVGPVKVLAAEPEGFFEQSVLRTVRAWRFRPGTVDGVIVQALVEQTISFRLR